MPISRSEIQKIAAGYDPAPILAAVGSHSALDIADAGHEVLLVERNPSIGGRMIRDVVVQEQVGVGPADQRAVDVGDLGRAPRRHRGAILDRILGSSPRTGGARRRNA